MREISKSNPLASWGFTTPSPLNSTLNQLKDISGDDIQLNDNYVSFYRVIYEMIVNGGGMSQGVSDIKYNSVNNSLEITYSNQPTKTINLVDKFLSNVLFNNDTNTMVFTLNDSTTISLDLTSLIDNFYEKEYIDNNFYDKNTVDDKISKNVLTWNEF